MYALLANIGAIVEWYYDDEPAPDFDAVLVPRPFNSTKPYGLAFTATRKES